MTTSEQARILAQAKRLAREYRQLTGKPLGITGEVAEYEAAQKLDVTLTPARDAGYDAVRDSDGQAVQAWTGGVGAGWIHCGPV